MSSTPFDHHYFIGYINEVSPQFIKVHFPSSVLLKTFTHQGEDLSGGFVGNFVVIEGEKVGFLGKILELVLPEKERLQLSEKSFQNKEFHPTGKIELLLSFDLFDLTKVEKGLNILPTIGAKVFVCSSGFIKSYFKGFGLKKDHMKDAPVIELGVLTYDNAAVVEISQQALFGRHCAVVGTTGGGKSYTVSKLIQGIIENSGKAILIDATGEYDAHDGKPHSAPACVLSEGAFFHYSNLTVGDLFVLLRPSGQVQAPKLMEAIKSLKILKTLKEKADGGLITRLDDNTYSVDISPGVKENIIIKDDVILKAGQLMRPFNRVYRDHISEIEGIDADFDIRLLSAQIIKECVNDVDFNNPLRWGTSNNNHLTNCISLILRVNTLVSNPEFEKIFGFNNSKTEPNELISKIGSFLNDANQNLLRIGFEKVSFDFQAREILANAIGKFMLEQARSGSFKLQPIVLFIDEAHQYLNKEVKDEYFEQTKLNSFDSIAKECRKYGLFLCIATQMPRDIPTGTLSQMGTFIVHRLINNLDKEAIANASSSANRNSLSFLPILGSGEAILMGVDFPMSVILKINAPDILPNSATPQFKKKPAPPANAPIDLP